MRQAVVEVGNYPAHACIPEPVGSLGCLPFALNAVDGLLHDGIEILNAQAGRVTPAAPSALAISAVSPRGSISLPQFRSCRRRKENRSRSKSRQGNELRRRDDSRRAAAEMHPDRPTAAWLPGLRLSGFRHEAQPDSREWAGPASLWWCGNRNTSTSTGRTGCGRKAKRDRRMAMLPANPHNGPADLR